MARYNREFSRGDRMPRDRRNREFSARDRARSPRAITGRDMQRAGEELHKMVGYNNPTPSTRPDDHGREWSNHKYIDKVQTKTGKVRYIYDDVEGGGSRHRNTNSVHEENQKRRRQNYERNMKATEEGQRNRWAQTKFGNSLAGRIHGTATRIQRDATKAFNEVSKNVRNATNYIGAQAGKTIANLSSSTRRMGKSWMTKLFGV